MEIRRKYDTREIFCSALSALLKKKEFDDVTVAEIIEVSGLSKSTFYRYFRDKYELATWQFSSLLEEFNKRKFTDLETGSACIEDLIEFMNEERFYFRKLIKYVGPCSLSDCYQRVSLEFAAEICKEKGRELSQKEKYTVIYHSSALMGVIQEWLLSNDRIENMDLCNVINSNRNEEIKRIYTQE